MLNVDPRHKTLDPRSYTKRMTRTECCRKPSYLSFFGRINTITVVSYSSINASHVIASRRNTSIELMASSHCSRYHRTFSRIKWQSSYKSLITGLPYIICLKMRQISRFLNFFPLSENGRLGMSRGVVSKETVVLRRWGSSIQKFGFINGVDNVNWPPYRDSKS